MLEHLLDMAENPGVRTRRAEPPWGYGAPEDTPPPPKPPFDRDVSPKTHIICVRLQEKMARALMPGSNIRAKNAEGAGSSA